MDSEELDMPEPLEDVSVEAFLMSAEMKRRQEPCLLMLFSVAFQSSLFPCRHYFYATAAKSVQCTDTKISLSKSQRGDR